MNEEWKPVSEFPADYRVSSLGRIKRISASNRADKEFLEGTLAKHGYRVITFTVGNICYQRYLHRIIAAAFIPNPESKRYINHKDGNKENNALDNIEWVTARENLIHRSRVLGLEIGINHHSAKLDNEKVCAIRELFLAGLSNTQIAAQFLVSRATIGAVRSKRTWFHVTQ